MNCEKGPDSDRDGFTALLRDLKEAFSKHDLSLSAAVSASRDIVDRGKSSACATLFTFTFTFTRKFVITAYDVPAISSYVDWLSLMTYDYHGYWEGKTNHIAPLFEQDHNSPDRLNVVSIAERGTLVHNAYPYADVSVPVSVYVVRST